MTTNSGRTIDRILISTMPRSGTVFFFDRIARLFEFEKLEPTFPDGLQPNPPEWDSYKIDNTYMRLDTGQVLCGHYVLNSDINTLLGDEGLLGVYLYRDPRDAAVSAAMYIKYVLSHFVLHKPFVGMSESDAITFLLSGGVIPVEYGCGYIHHDGMKYFCDWGLDWINHPNVVKIRYEDLVVDGVRAIQSALSEVNIALDATMYQRILHGMNFENITKGRLRGVEDKGSHYRKGIVGDYKNNFNELHKAICKHRIGDFLIKCGYEKGYEW